MRQLWLLPLLLLTSFLSAQTPAPTCSNGAYNFVFEAVISGMQQVLSPYPHTSAWGFGGSVRDCTYWPSIAPGNSMKWRTGPPLNINPNTGEATFAACDGTDPKCGLYWHVDNYGGSVTHLGCSTTTPCTFKGKWNDFSVTLDPAALSAGVYIYVQDGHATGTYCDHIVGCITTNVTYHQNSLPFAGPFLADQRYGGGAWGGAAVEFELSTEP